MMSLSCRRCWLDCMGVGVTATLYRLQTMCLQETLYRSPSFIDDILQDPVKSTEKDKVGSIPPCFTPVVTANVSVNSLLHRLSLAVKFCYTGSSTRSHDRLSKVFSTNIYV